MSRLSMAAAAAAAAKRVRRERGVVKASRSAGGRPRRTMRSR